MAKKKSSGLSAGMKMSGKTGKTAKGSSGRTGTGSGTGACYLLKSVRNTAGDKG